MPRSVCIDGPPSEDAALMHRVSRPSARLPDLLDGERRVGAGAGAPAGGELLVGNPSLGPHVARVPGPRAGPYRKQVRRQAQADCVRPPRRHRLDHHRSDGPGELFEVGAPPGSPEPDLDGAGVAAGHAQPGQVLEGLHDARALGVGKGVHVRRGLGDGHVTDPHGHPEFHVVHAGDGGAALGPRTGIAQPPDHEERLAGVEGLVLDGTPVEGNGFAGRHGLAGHAGAGSSTMSNDHSSLWVPTGGGGPLAAASPASDSARARPVSPRWPWANAGEATQASKDVSSRQRVTTSQTSRWSAGCNSSNPSKPSASSTAPVRLANRRASSSPEPSRTVMALILTTVMVRSLPDAPPGPNQDAGRGTGVRPRSHPRNYGCVIP